MDWLDLLAVQGTLKSLLQHHSSKTSILQCSAFFTVQLSHPYITTGQPGKSYPFFECEAQPHEKMFLFNSTFKSPVVLREHIQKQRHYFAD